MRPVLLVLMMVGCKSESEPVGAFGWANIDDDDGNGRRDWPGANADDDDRAPLLLEANRRSAKSLTLTVSDAEHVRVWLDGVVLLDADTPSAEVPYAKEPLPLEVEFETYNVDVTLEITEHNKGGKVIGEPWSVPLRSGPVLINHHLLPAIQVQSVDIPGYTDPLVNTYDSLLGERYVAADGFRYDFDVWMQDEIEFVSVHGRDGYTNAVLDSIRDRGLDNFPEDVLVGPGMGKIIKGDPFYATSQDSFGNLEATPPIDGYPFGRIYYGDTGDNAIDPELADFLESDGAQAPFTLDVSWLCVGHVDEFVTMIPDQTSPKGFRVAIADTNRAWELLEGMDPNTALPKYIADYGVRNVGDLVNSNELRTLNAETQRLYIDPAKAKLIEELGLEESDFIYFPDIFEVTPQCFGGQAALIPGMINLVVDNPRGGPSRIFMADPFIRSDLADPALDPFINEVKRILPIEHQPVFVDNWEAYHIALGEVHCGTNVSREPHAAPWWPVEEPKKSKKEEE